MMNLWEAFVSAVEPEAIERGMKSKFKLIYGSLGFR